MKLVNPNDDQLNIAFGERVCGWKWIPLTGGAPYWEGNYFIDELGSWHFPDDHEDNSARFMKSFDALLPRMAMMDSVEVRLLFCFGVPKCWQVDVGHGICIERAEDVLLPKAAVIALLRAHGVEVEFT